LWQNDGKQFFEFATGFRAGSMKLSTISIFSGIAFVLGTLAAQEPVRAPDGGTISHVDGVDLLAIPGRPLTGKSSVEWTRTLEDGSTVSVHEIANLARDSQGRMYRERRRWVPVESDLEAPLIEMQFFDPIARTKTICTVGPKECAVSAYHPRTALIAMPTGPFAGGTRYLTRESLGADRIDGLDVTGTRETTTVNAGVVGNSAPLVSTREFWYSDAIQTNIAVTRIDPREGKQVVRLIDLSLSEPDPRVFALPKGFTLNDARSSAQRATATLPSN
jgi:hypothetical protein